MRVNFFDEALEKFVENLEPDSVAKLLRTIDLLEKFGSSLGTAIENTLRDPKETP